MKIHHIAKAAQLADMRLDLFTLRTEALVNTVTVSAGTSPLEVEHKLALELIDALIRQNESDLKELGVTDIGQWRMPHRPAARPAAQPEDKPWGPGGPKE